MKTESHHHSVLRAGLVTLTDALFFSLTSPTANNSIMIIVGVGLLGITAYYWLALAARAVASFRPIPSSSQRTLAACATAAILFLVSMQSIGQLGWGDVLATVPLAAGLYAYLTYRSRASTSDIKA